MGITVTSTISVNTKRLKRKRRTTSNKGMLRMSARAEMKAVADVPLVMLVSAERELAAAVMNTASEMVKRIKERAPQGSTSAALKQSIKATPVSDPLTYRISSSSHYAPYVEFGTAPNASVPYQPILDWVKSNPSLRGSVSDDEGGDKELAFRIWRSIKQKGTEANPFFFNTIAEMEPEFRRAVKDALARARSNSGNP